LRRRRRQATQIIRKKSVSSPPVTSYHSPIPKKRIGRKIFYTFLIIIILGTASYYLYNLTFSGQTTPFDETVSETITDSITITEDEVPESAPFEHQIQIEILNGCGVNGVAKIFQSYLRQQGFDVVNTENYTVKGKVFWDVKQSFVIDQIGVAEQAKSVARSLGIPIEKVESRENPDAIYDVSVVIGNDYKSILPQ
jgi:hypothetical protein